LPTLSETAWVAIIGLITTLFGALLAPVLSARLQRDSEIQKVIIEQFAPRRIEALSNLNAALVELYSRLRLYRPLPGDSSIYAHYNEVQASQEAFLRSRLLAAIYLDDPAQRAMDAAHRALGPHIINLQDRAFHVIAPSEHPAVEVLSDWQDAGEKIDAAIDYLQRLLNPGPVTRLAGPKR
jgi:hypothetical protein